MITIIGDSHFGKNKRSDKFLLKFLDVVKTDSLVLMGDIFHFYFEYRHGVYKENLPLVYALLDVKKRGIEVIFVPGNHDLWVGNFLRENFRVLPERADVILEDKKFHLLHYVKINSIIKSKLVTTVFSLLPLDAGYNLGIKIGQITEKRDKKEKLKAILDYSQKIKADFVVFGHTHVPLIKYLPDKILLNPGGWINAFSYIEIKNGVPYFNFFRTP